MEKVMINYNKAKPILFNTEMVKAILEGKKTVTRRLIKYDGKGSWEAFNNVRERDESATIPCYLDREVSIDDKSRNIIYPAYDIGDVLYVRETWRPQDFTIIDGRWSCSIKYKVGESTTRVFWEDGEDPIYDSVKWHPSIHMPKEAARIWLEVTEVRAERLQDIEHNEVLKEGINECNGRINFNEECACVEIEFQQLWDSTIKKQNHDKYGWEANPWVWVIEFKILETVLEKGEEQC